MKEYFEEQLKEHPFVEKDDLLMLKGKGLYSDYQAGDQVLYFLNMTIEDVGRMNYNIVTTVEREFDQLERNFIYIESKLTMPVLVDKKLEDTDHIQTYIKLLKGENK